MPIERIPSEEAFARLRKVRSSVWPDGRRDSSRLEGIASVDIQPTFRFSPSDPIFTTGSCFAREIENYLKQLGFDVPMLDFSLPREERASEQGNDFLNKYTIHSMEYEIRWAFEEPPLDYEKLFLQVGDDLWHDPHLVPNLVPAKFDRIIERRKQTMQATAALSRCGIAVATLGLAESWYDQETGLYLNGAPPPAALKRNPGRFALHVLSYDEILQGLERLYGLLRTYGRPDIRMLLTVSPVPFKATFTGTDALAANCYSKSVQRAVCREFVARHSDVDYFPSYEIVTLTERTTAYEKDNIHVRRPVVAKIMQHVVKNYCPDVSLPAEEDAAVVLRLPEGAGFEELLAIARRTRATQDYELGVQAMERIFRSMSSQIRPEQRATIHILYGILLLRTRRTEQGLAELRHALGYEPLNPTAHYKTGLALARLKRSKEALAFFGSARHLDPANAEYAWRLGIEKVRSGDVEHGRADLEAALALDPTHRGASEALARLAPDTKAAAAE